MDYIYMKKLALAFIYYNGDYQNVSKISNILLNSNIDTEVYIWDNTIGNKLKYFDDKYHIYGDGKNHYQFYGRVKLLKLIKEEYVWFIDGDDDVDYIPLSILDSNCDEILVPTNAPGDIYNDDGQVKSRLGDNQLWNKIVKTSILKKANYPLYNNIVANEDELFSKYVELHMKSYYRYFLTPMYKYKGFRGLQDIISNDTFRHITLGLKKTIRLFYRKFSKKEADSMVDSDVSLFLSCIGRLTDIDYCYSILHQEMGRYLDKRLNDKSYIPDNIDFMGKDLKKSMDMLLKRLGKPTYTERINNILL